MTCHATLATRRPFTVGSDAAWQLHILLGGSLRVGCGSGDRNNAIGRPQLIAQASRSANLLRFSNTGRAFHSASTSCAEAGHMQLLTRGDGNLASLSFAGALRHT